jgi:hypothetical protein
MDHDISFKEKRQLFGVKKRKSPKIVIITWTPGLHFVSTAVAVSSDVKD